MREIKRQREKETEREEGTEGRERRRKHKRKKVEQGERRRQGGREEKQNHQDIIQTFANSLLLLEMHGADYVHQKNFLFCSPKLYFKWSFGNRA